jgi:hypothetical protein
MTKVARPGVVYRITDPERFGYIPVRTELTVLPADDPKNKTIGWTVKEGVGVGVFNSRNLRRVCCPVCGEETFDLLDHAHGKDDPDHEILSVMTT